MKRIGMMAAVIALALQAGVAAASDSIAAGVRVGSATGHETYYTEVFGDLYLNRLVSIGATFAYISQDRHLERDRSLPITALFKVHAPIKAVQPYAGLGLAVIFRERLANKGTPVMLGGVDIPLGSTPLFLNAELRHEFNDSLTMLAGGLGVKF